MPSGSSVSSKTCSQASQRSKRCSEASQSTSESLSQGSQSSLVCKSPGTPPPKRQRVHLRAYVKDLCFEMKQANRLKSDKEACDWVSQKMPDIFCPTGVPLSVKTVLTWRAKMNSNINDERPKGTKGKQKKGRKPSRPLGEVPAPVPGKSHSIIPHTLLCVLAVMIVSQYGAGFTITTPSLAPLVLVFLETHGITWKPAKCWFGRFLHRIRLSWPRTTKAARSTPVDLAETRRMFLPHVIYICGRYNVPPSLFINTDETGIFLFPLQKRIWGPAGAKQVAIVGNGDRRQSTLVVGITASGKLAGRSQIIWAGETTGCHPKGD